MQAIIMKNNRLLNSFSIALVVVLLLSLINVMNVLADDNVPPANTGEPGATEEPVMPEVSVVAEKPLATEAPIVPDVPVSTEEPVATEEPVLSDALGTDEASVATGEPVIDMPPILEQLPEDTAMVVYDENGNILPLASQAAADALVEPDPQFCPVGLPPLDPGCSAVRGTIAQAVADAYAAGVDGTIYVAAGTFTENVTIDGGLFSGSAPSVFSLVGIGSATTILDGYIQISNMNSFTLSGFTVNNYVQAHDNNGALNLTDIVAGASGSVSDGGAIVHVTNHAGDVALTNVTANNGSDFGARLNNTSGSGNISVDNSTFTGNVLGMEAYSAGNITLTNSIASSNILNGAYLDTSAGMGDVNVDNSVFNANNIYGLVSYSAGDITLNGVTANNTVNYNGVYVDAALYGTGNISISNSVVTGNGYNGLDAYSKGNINLSDVTISSNVNNGAWIDNSGGTGNITVDNSTFNLNGVYGLFGLSAGSVTMDGIVASNNGTIGASIDGVGASSDISVSNGTFIGNSDSGLVLTSTGTVTLDRITADSNTINDGTFINAAGNVTITCSAFDNNGNYGANNAGGSSMTFDLAVTFSGNGTGPYNGPVLVAPSFCGVAVPPTVIPPTSTGAASGGNGRPLHFVPVSGASTDLPTPLDCVSYRGTRLFMPNDDGVVFLCPLQITSKLETLAVESLPGELPNDTTYVSGFITRLIQKSGSEQTGSLARAALVSFTIPEDMRDANLEILSWNTEQGTWVKVDPGVNTGDPRYDDCVKTLMGRFDNEINTHLEACVDYTGMFALASY
jgi:hypothetical protein